MCTPEKQLQQDAGRLSVGLRCYFMTFLAFGLVEGSDLLGSIDFRKVYICQSHDDGSDTEESKHS